MFPVLKTSYKGGLVLNETPHVALFKNFLTVDQCNRIIKLAQATLQRAKVSSDEGAKLSDGRTGSNAWLSYKEFPDIKELGEAVSELVGIPLSHAESLQVIHYGPEQKYGAHYDAYDLNSAKGQRCCNLGGQRLLTCLMYLNTVPQGGGTGFPKLDLEIKAEQGDMIVFHNVDTSDYSKAHPKSIHGGLEVIEGEKWACNLWFHQATRSKKFDFEAFLNQPSNNSPTKQAITQPQHIEAVSNRATALFKQAAKNLSDELGSEAIKNQAVLYWDSSKNNPRNKTPEPFTNSPVRTFKLVNRASILPLADKGRLPVLLKQYGIDNLGPETFFSIEEASQSDHDFFYIKNRYLTAGQGIRCVSREDLKNEDLSDSEVIQAAINNIKTLNNRKFTIRGYVLLAANGLAVYPSGIVVIHGVDYSPLSTDYEVQIQHTGYNDRKSPVKMASTEQLDIANDFTTALNKLVVHLSPILLPICSMAKADEYAILGVDLLPTEDGEFKLIEINAFPNFVHTKEINQAINVPMLQWAMRGLVKLPIASP